MKHSTFPFGWISSILLLWVMLLSFSFKVYWLDALAGVFFFPLTGFLVVRAIIRWMGKQWCHGAAQGR